MEATFLEATYLRQLIGGDLLGDFTRRLYWGDLLEAT